MPYTNQQITAEHPFQGGIYNESYFLYSKTYDKESFTKELVNYPDIEVKFLRTELTRLLLSLLTDMTLYVLS